MREPYLQLYVHLVWATWDRLPLLTEELIPRVYACIRAECAKLNAKAIAIGGTADHVHLLVSMPATLSVSALVKQLKGASSHMVTHCAGKDDVFKWQGGYGAFTVSKSQGAAVRSYILRQSEHHREGTTDKDSEVAWVEHQAEGFTEPGE